ncbi:nucleotidyltransferase domain-containing protein [Methanofollis fontis]|uniref:Nucleotidyltransferase domain-containing protein n=2 Tax=Methanofollis fontis TaxID=2052832 RepID=A0A483CX63_9EURY|nr:nucleotidyltransferase domain-containing protein [Methanofollis fontis]
MPSEEGVLSIQERDWILSRLSAIEGFDRVRFIILYGSYAEGRAMADSDVDLCIYYNSPPEDSSAFRFRALSELYSDRYDVQIFEQLPLYIRMDVLKGRVLYCPDERFLYDIALETIREFDDFKHRLYDYIGERVMS